MRLRIIFPSLLTAGLATLVLFSCTTVIAQLPEEKLIKVACVGDNITFGYGLTNRVEDCYPAQLARFLGPRYEVKNFGYSGTTILGKGDLPYRELPILLEAQKYDADIVVVLLGTNDSKKRNIKHKHDFIQDYEFLLHYFADSASAPHIWLATPPPAFSKGREISGERIEEEIIPLIKKVSSRTNLLLIDLHTPLLQRKKMFPDTVHPDELGSRAIAALVFTALGGKALLEPKPEQTVEEEPGEKQSLVEVPAAKEKSQADTSETQSEVPAVLETIQEPAN